MNSGHDFERIAEDWLNAGSDSTPPHVIDAVLFAVRSTPQERDLRVPWRNLLVKYPVYAVAVIAVLAVVGITAFNAFGPGLNVAGPGPTDSPDLTESPTPARRSPVAAPTVDYTPSCLVSRSATDLNEVARGRLDPGTYSYCGVGASLVNVRFTVPAGWTWDGSYLSKGGIGAPDGGAIFFLAADDLLVYDDPCQWAGAELGLRPGDSVQDIVDALAAQPMRSATTPTVRNAAVPSGPGDMPGRWPGLALELTVPDDIDFADCDGGEFRSWGPDAGARSHQGPGQRDLVWVVTHGAEDVRQPGDLLVIDAATFPGTPTDVVTEIEAILDSLAIGHWG